MELAQAKTRLQKTKRHGLVYNRRAIKFRFYKKGFARLTHCATQSIGTINYSSGMRNECHAKNPAYTEQMKVRPK